MRVLSLIHQDDAPTGTFAVAVQERGGDLLEWNLARGVPPEPPETFDAVLVFGGGMHVDQEDQHPWLREEDDLIKGLLAAELPLGAPDGSDGYAVTTERTGAWLRRDRRVHTTRGVVVAAGPLGTNKLLARS